MRLSGAALLGLCGLLLANCASLPTRSPPAAPSLRLSPAALGAEFSVQQRLEVSHAGRSQRAEALLEIDESALRLVLLAGPKRLLTLVWDGSELQQLRQPGLPDALQGERFVDDIQLAYWPAQSIRAALPVGWTLDDTAKLRTLRFQDSLVVSIDYSGSPRWFGRIVINRPGAGYRLSIDSIAVP